MCVEACVTNCLWFTLAKDIPKKMCSLLSHNLGYLSWSRNAAICAGVGATLRIIEETLPTGTEDFVMGKWEV